MALAAISGGRSFIGQDAWSAMDGAPGFTSFNLDLANEALIFTGQIITSDGGSHTINTTGSSSLGWRTGASATFNDAGTTIKVGLAGVDPTGRPTRAVNVSDVITFDVSADFVGGAGGIAGAATWQNSVPTTGTKTIANGDYIAFAVQMTARGGSDVVTVSSPTVSVSANRPTSVTHSGGTYTASLAGPGVLITFADGALGWMAGGTIASNVTTRVFHSGSSPNEYGQLFSLPFPTRVIGIYGWEALNAGGDHNVVLYSNPLGTPVAERTVFIDGDNVAALTGRKFEVMFPTPYDVSVNTPIAITLKPTTTNSVTAYYKTLANAAHRIADHTLATGYGVSRSSGAFANANSNLEHYYLGLITGAYDDGAAPGAAWVKQNGVWVNVS
jgi:hypothetical protein